MYDPNDLAVLMVMVMLLGIGMTLRERPLWKLVGAVVGSRRTGYRAQNRIPRRNGRARGWHCRLRGSASRALLPARRNGRGRHPSSHVAFGPESFRVRTASLLDIQNDYTFNSDAGRWMIWQRGLGYFAHRPIIGVGANNYGELRRSVLRQRRPSGRWLTAHNTYLQVLVEIGIFGAIALGGMMVAAVRACLPAVAPVSCRRTRAPATGRRSSRRSMAFLSSALFLSHGYNPLLFFSVALSAYAGRVGQAERVGVPTRV